jgi:hypothetical protein
VPQYIIERNIPGISKVGYEQYKQIAKKSNSVLAGMKDEGTDVIWHHSYVAGDKIYCVYDAPNEEAVREHAKRGSFPADLIVEVTEVMTAATGQ